MRDEVEDAVKFADESPKPVRPLGVQAARLLPEKHTCNCCRDVTAADSIVASAAHPAAMSL